jgi:hypothetical protein
MLRRWMERWRAALAQRLEQEMADTRTVRGVRVDVTNTRPDIKTEDVFRRADAILALVEQYQPWRYRHLVRDISAIVVKRFPCRGAYFPATRECLLELTFMVNPSFNDAQVASTLVHEGMHARIDQFCARIGSVDTPDRAARTERACRYAELDFGLAVPNGELVVERARASLALEDEEVAPAIDWAEAARRVASVDQQALDARRNRS